MQIHCICIAHKNIQRGMHDSIKVPADACCLGDSNKMFLHFIPHWNWHYASVVIVLWPNRSGME